MMVIGVKKKKELSLLTLVTLLGTTRHKNILNLFCSGPRTKSPCTLGEKYESWVTLWDRSNCFQPSPEFLSFETDKIFMWKIIILYWILSKEYKTFKSLIVLARTANNILKRSGQSGHPCLILYLKEEILVFHSCIRC